MTANPIPEAAVDALYDELFRVGRYLHAPVPIDPKGIIRRHLTAAQQQAHPAPPSAPVGVDFAAVASILRRAMRDGVHYGYRRDFILQQALALEALAQQPAAVDGLAARLVDELDGLVGESYGVSGLHLNGDVAPWDELLPGGRFERLSSLDELRAALAAQQQGGRDHG